MVAPGNVNRDGQIDVFWAIFERVKYISECDALGRSVARCLYTMLYMEVVARLQVCNVYKHHSLNWQIIEWVWHERDSQGLEVLTGNGKLEKSLCLPICYVCNYIL